MKKPFEPGWDRLSPSEIWGVELSLREQLESQVVLPEGEQWLRYWLDTKYVTQHYFACLHLMWKQCPDLPFLGEKLAWTDTALRHLVKPQATFSELNATVVFESDLEQVLEDRQLKSLEGQMGVVWVLERVQLMLWQSYALNEFMTSKGGTDFKFDRFFHGHGTESYAHYSRFCDMYLNDLDANEVIASAKKLLSTLFQ